MKIPLLSLIGLCCVLGFSGCETDGSAPEVSTASNGKGKKNLSPEELAKLPPVVMVSIDSSYDSPKVVVNGYDAGYAPLKVYLEVDASGRLPYQVQISVDPSGHSDSRSARGVGSNRGPQILTKDYPAGKIPPSKIYFDPVATREEGQATERAKPGTRATAERMQ